MKIVLDTNVLVSGMLNPDGPPGRIVLKIADAGIVLCYDSRILAEYRRVLLYQKFNFDAQHVDALVDMIRANGIPVAPSPLPYSLPDPDDDKFMEAAIAGNTDYLITGNLKHFPKSRHYHVRVISPSELIRYLKTRSFRE